MLIRFLSLARRKLRLCSANHRSGYWSNLPCDWPSTAWAYSDRKRAVVRWLVYIPITLLWRHYGRDGISNHQPYDCLHNRLFRCRSKKISKLRVTGFCAGNSPVTDEFPAERASNAKNVAYLVSKYVTNSIYCTERCRYICIYHNVIFFIRDTELVAILSRLYFEIY